ncbi:hypothetical protein B0H66DRAFT_584262 [Apodospora peruviana]|uniref:Uncharacterized protein n=1 Tax=Apodospora peruviana TaxID=516989 RepID=A0AAE0LY31_9PEZI|nr:hypothetical protein B0H66DRAFT_585245 [Apodospora peruviana]KAK3313678.1 hypothetical protein B0H66DRAFT_584262 [Apodospora peruviana]
MRPDPYKYPGIDLPLRYFPQKYEYPDDPDQSMKFYIGGHPDFDESWSNLLPVREVAMMILVDRLTDKPNWHDKVFNDEIVAKWRNEALNLPEDAVYSIIVQDKQNLMIPQRTRLITEKAFDNCVAELKAKAEFFKNTGLIYTLNGNRVNEYPEPKTFTVGKTLTVIKSDTVVSSDLHHDQASEPDWHPWTNEMVQDLIHPSMYPFVYDRSKFIHREVVRVSNAIEKWSGKGDVPSRDSEESADGAPDVYWSEKYQWLPANLSFQVDSTVKFASYVNNLHPKKYPDIYGVIEKVIDIAIPAWDHALTGQVLVKDLEDDNGFNAETLAAVGREKGPIQLTGRELNDEKDIMNRGISAGEALEEEGDAELLEKATIQLKWEKIRDPIIPEPKDYHKGLQVIVKMESIELTPDKPEFPAGGWHIEGQLNEHIVATALYYLDSENVTHSTLSFRMQTSSEQEELQMRLGPVTSKDPCVQDYGSVETVQGYLLAFPNTFQHRVSSFGLKDPSKPGHRRFIALWLVDPNMRIISTGNVPSQQLDWWFEALVGPNSQTVKGEMPADILQLLVEQGDAAAKLTQSRTRRLPREILDMICRAGLNVEGPMTDDEARQHRISLMEERSNFQKKSEDIIARTGYSFCEH